MATSSVFSSLFNLLDSNKINDVADLPRRVRKRGCTRPGGVHGLANQRSGRPIWGFRFDEPDIPPDQSGAYGCERNQPGGRGRRLWRGLGDHSISPGFRQKIGLARLRGQPILDSGCNRKIVRLARSLGHQPVESGRAALDHRAGAFDSQRALESTATRRTAGERKCWSSKPAAGRLATPFRAGAIHA